MAMATALRSNTFVAHLFVLVRRPPLRPRGRRRRRCGGGGGGLREPHLLARPGLRIATNTVAVAFRAPQGGGAGEDDGWVAWGINPTGAGMVGAQAVVAFRSTDGSLTVYSTVLGSYAPSMAPAAAGELALLVSGVAAESVDGEMVVYATVALPAGKGSKVSHVWQRGSSVVNDVSAAHPTAGDNVPTASIDFSK
ncbi:hypothetical protein ACP4OV_001243 [Aristida adscensionis]